MTNYGLTSEDIDRLSFWQKVRYYMAPEAHDAAYERRKAERVERAVQRVLRALEDEGRNPEWHRKTMAKHRSEWPTLWAALDKLREAQRGRR